MIPAPASKARLDLAKNLLAQGRFAGALDLLNQFHGQTSGARQAGVLRSSCYQRLGEVDAALKAYRELLSRYPTWAEAHSNLLIAMQYNQGFSAQEIFSAHVEWAKKHFPAPAPQSPACSDAKVLRIGWVSSSFRKSPVAIFFKSAAQHLPRQGFKHVFYHNGLRTDELTTHFQRASDQWRETGRLSHAAFARRVREDGVHVLVEMTGHGPRSRLQALHSRPAALQISWLDYFHSTGAYWMDAFLADRFLVPEASRRFFVESVQYLPRGRLCYSVPEQAPPPGPVAEGKVVLGCFNRLAKLNDHTLGAWATLMARLPESKLFLRALGFDDAATRNRFTTRARKAGLPLERVRLAGAGGYGDVLESYRAVDVALDPFPFSGCATTCDALWMGVPVVSLCGETMASRQSAALLSSIGLDELIAHSRGDYVDKALALATDVERRRELRRTLRPRVRQYLGDAPRFAEDLCGTIRQLWEDPARKNTLP